LNLENLRERLLRLGLHGLLANLETIIHEPCWPQLLQIEETERARRSFRRRLKAARLQKYNPMADFDWSWPPSAIGAGRRTLFPELHRGAGQHRADRAERHRQDDASEESPASGSPARPHSPLHARLRHVARLGRPGLLYLAHAPPASLHQPSSPRVDEVGYLSYDSRYADLFFEVITRRYQRNPVIITTNKPFGEWTKVFRMPAASSLSSIGSCIKPNC